MTYKLTKRIRLNWSYNSSIVGTSLGKAVFSCVRVTRPNIWPNASTEDVRTYHKWEITQPSNRNDNWTVKNDYKPQSTHTKDEITKTYNIWKKNQKPIIGNANSLFCIGTCMRLLSIIYTCNKTNKKYNLMQESPNEHTQDANT